MKKIYILILLIPFFFNVWGSTTYEVKQYKKNSTIDCANEYQSKPSDSRRSCAIRCHFDSICRGLNFDSNTRVCSLYSHIWISILPSQTCLTSDSEKVTNVGPISTTSVPLATGIGESSYLDADQATGCDVYSVVVGAYLVQEQLPSGSTVKKIGLLCKKMYSSALATFVETKTQIKTECTAGDIYIGFSSTYGPCATLVKGTMDSSTCKDRGGDQQPLWNDFPSGNHVIRRAACEPDYVMIAMETSGSYPNEELQKIKCCQVNFP